MAARYSRLVRRRGPNKAGVATAHSILIAVHHMLSTGEVYRDLGAEFYDKRTDPDRKTRPHIAELEAARYTVTQPSAASPPTTPHASGTRPHPTPPPPRPPPPHRHFPPPPIPPPPYPAP